ncbi:hypothetical protein LCGC14_2875640, partial [marine sediment metagenome]
AEAVSEYQYYISQIKKIREMNSISTKNEVDEDDRRTNALYSLYI